MCEGEPDRVPLLELIICREVMGASLGLDCPAETWKEVIDFLVAAGYDAVNVCPFINRNPAGIMPQEGVFARVLRQGTVKTGDEIAVIDGGHSG